VAWNKGHGIWIHIQKFISYFKEDTFRLNYKENVYFVQAMWNVHTQCVFLLRIVTTGHLKDLTFKALSDKLYMARNVLRNWYSLSWSGSSWLCRTRRYITTYFSNPPAGPRSAPNDPKALIDRITMDTGRYFRHYFNRTCRMSVVFDFRLKWRKILTWWSRGKEAGTQWWRLVPSYPPVYPVSTLRQEVTQTGVIRVLQRTMPGQ